jgi:hypothetical protein
MSSCNDLILDDTIISHVVFAENYTFQVQNKIQSMYYHSYQLSILVHITYRVNLDYIEDGDEPRIILDEQ